MGDSESEATKSELTQVGHREVDGPVPVKSWGQYHKNEDAEENAKKLRQTDLFSHRKQTYHGLVLLWVAFQSTGTIYGDIGTSPLYVFSSTFTSQPSWDDLVGAVSIIIWSLTLIVTVKYAFIILRADDDGQGGTFALYSLLARFTNIEKAGPHNPALGINRHKTNDLKPVGRGIRSIIEHSTLIKYSLRLVGVIGVSMVMADGVLTPAQSILGAMQGITVANPNLTINGIVGSTCAILVVLFLIQPFGTAKIGTVFAPIVVVWLLFLAFCGIYNLAKFDTSVLKSFNPAYAIWYFKRNGTDGWKSLGGLLLAFTGVEALFADLGAFSRRAIQLSWLCFAYPCLLLAYIGQAAFISADLTGLAWSNPFYLTLPSGTLYFGLVIANLASFVASQAMITSSFQLLSQIMRLSYFPRVKVVHTSKQFHDQIYVPLINWLLLAGTIIVTVAYNNTTALGNAYGVCVIAVTFITTCMTTLVALLVWRVPTVIVLFFFLVFGCLDGLYLSSVIQKVPQGAWFTLLLAFLLTAVFALWRYGKEQQWSAEAEDKLKSDDVISTAGDGSHTLTAQFGGRPVTNGHGVGIFFDKVGEHIPKVFVQFVRKFRARPGIVIFFHMRPLSQPTVPEEERYVISRTAVPSCYRLVLRHGYTEDPISPDLGKSLVDRIVSFICRDNDVDHNRVIGGGSTEGQQQQQLADRGEFAAYPPEIRAELELVCAARDDQITYVIGKEVLKVRRGARIAGFPRHVLLQAFLWLRENTRAKLAKLDMKADDIVEVGFLKMI